MAVQTIHAQPVAPAAPALNRALLVIIAFFIPPLAVALKEGIGGALLINIILTLLLWLPGFIHALIVVLR